MNPLRAAGAMVLALLIPATAAWAPPPLRAVTLPGPDLGVTETEWLLPYVRLLREGVASEEPREDCGCCFLGTGTVTWFSESGDVLHEIRGADGHVGFLRTKDGVAGILPYWEMPHPTAGIDRDGFIGASSTGRFFVHLFHPAAGALQVDVYDAGRPTYTLGPFALPERGDGRVRVNERGVCSLTIVDFAGERSRLLLAGADGSVRMDRTLAVEFPHAHPDPGGTGLLWEERRGEEKVKYWSAPGRDDVALDVWGNSSHVMCWTDDGAVLMYEWSPEGFRYTLIDLASGRSRWRVPAADSRRARVLGSVHDDGWIYLYDLPVEARGDDSVGRHRITAVDVADGRPLHVWESSAGSPVPRPGRLLSLDDGVWFLTPREFTRIDRATVLAGRQGWRPAES